MLGDLDRKAIEPYGVMLEERAGYSGIADRATFVIDRSGTVVHAERAKNPGDQPDPDAALEAVRKIAEG